MSQAQVIVGSGQAQEAEAVMGICVLGKTTYLLIEYHGQ